MNEDILYWIWLSQSLKYGSCNLKKVYETIKNIQDFYKGGINEWKMLGCFTQQELEALASYSLAQAEKILNKCQALKHDIICLNDKKYPNRLKNICNPPAVIYVDGKIPDIDNLLSIAIVGTRSATKYGVDIAFDFGFKLAKANAIVISGGAIGVDCSSQKGALAARGQVVSVLGCGIDHKYLMENKSLRDTIAKNGAVISEYPPGTKSDRWNFPMRNRIISGLSLGTLVVEAGQKSGSLITANLCLEQNRDLFAVPGSLDSSVSKGTNNLIKECAKPVTCVEDILEEYILNYPNLITQDMINKKEVSTYNVDKKEIYENKISKDIEKLSKRAHAIFDILESEPLNINDLAIKANLDVATVLQAITELEIYDLIRSLPGRRYSLKNNL